MKMCQAYTQLGHQVTLVVPEISDLEGYSETEIFDFYGVTSPFAIYRFRPRHPFKLWYACQLPREIKKKFRPEMIHTRNEWVAWGACRLYSQSTILELHVDYPPRTLAAWAISSTYRSKNLRMLVSITDALRKRLMAFLDDDRKICIAPDGVDDALLQRLSTAQEVRAIIDQFSQGKPLAVYTGHLYEGRGIELIAETARLTPSYQFIVVGGNDVDVVKWRSRAAGIENLCFLGFVPPSHVFNYLLAADALLLPYASVVAHAGVGNIASVMSPMKLFEYLAAGKAIIASELPVLREVLHDRENCLIVPFSEPRAWSGALVNLQTQPDLKRSLASAARAAASKYTWKTRAQCILQSVK